VVVLDLIRFSVGLFFDASRFVCLLVEDALGTGQLIHKVATNLGLFSDQKLELFKGPSCVGDLITATVKTESCLVLTSSLVIRKHSVAVFHVKNLIVDTTVVSGLTAQVVKLLAQLGN